MRRLLAVIIGACTLALIAAAVVYAPATMLNPRNSDGVRLVAQKAARPDPSIAEPVTLKIPALGVEANIQPVGQTATGAMATPQGRINSGRWRGTSLVRDRDSRAARS
jgi:hypothetical protein